MEEEIQARVEFKLNEILSAIENTANTQWHLSFLQNSQKHSHYWEALTMLKAIFKKESQMATPYDDMAAQRNRIIRDKAVDDIIKLFQLQGQRGAEHKIKNIVSIIETLQQDGTRQKTI